MRIAKVSGANLLERAVRSAAAKAAPDFKDAREMSLDAERSFLTAIIEELIARVDEIDGDPDFEPETDRGCSEDEPAFTAAICEITDGARWLKPVFTASGAAPHPAEATS